MSCLVMWFKGVCGVSSSDCTPMISTAGPHSGAICLIAIPRGRQMHDSSRQGLPSYGLSPLPPHSGSFSAQDHAGLPPQPARDDGSSSPRDLIVEACPCTAPARFGGASSPMVIIMVRPAFRCCHALAVRGPARQHCCTRGGAHGRPGIEAPKQERVRASSHAVQVWSSRCVWPPVCPACTRLVDGCAELRC